MKPIRIRYLGPFGLPSGYGQACNDYLKCLARIPEVELDIRCIIEVESEDIDARYQDLIPFVNNHPEQNWPTHFVVHTIPFYGIHLLKQAMDRGIVPTADHKRIAISTWETSTLPMMCVESLRNFDETWWPSTWNVNIAKAEGLKALYAPHAFDPEWWAREVNIPHEDDRYTFYSILTWCERKNPIGLLKAYLTGFTSKDHVVLKIVTPSYNKGDIDSLKQALNIPERDLPALEILGNPRLSEDELLALHRNSDCYVSTARAEGFGLGMFEACIVGNMVLAPGYAGETDFLGTHASAGYGYQLTPAIVPFTLADTTKDIGGIQVRPMQHFTHIGIAGDQHWAEPNLYQLQRDMRHVMGEPRGEFARDNIMKLHQAEFSYEAVTKRLRRNLGL